MRQTRSINGNFTVREADDNPVIEGYFAVFNSDYQIAPDMTESIAPGAFEGELTGDVRALVNHDTTLVLGRTLANTLTLREDEKGLWGSIEINRKDSDAMNLYERVKRGDVTQCSFGFEIPAGGEDSEVRADGSVHWTIRRVKLFEVSCCTFPAYADTNISARSDDARLVRKRAVDAWKITAKRRLSDVKSTDAAEED